MFDKLKGLAGLAGLAKDLPRIKARMEEVKARLPDLVCQASAGGSAVTATANGKLRLTKLTIQPSVLTGMAAGDASSRMMAESLILEAVNLALDRAQEATTKELTSAARELDLPIPPGMLENLI